jgi:hypothetical protein
MLPPAWAECDTHHPLLALRHSRTHMPAYSTQQAHHTATSHSRLILPLRRPCLTQEFELAFQMFLVLFRRELPWEQTFQFWEMLWACEAVAQEPLKVSCGVRGGGWRGEPFCAAGVCRGVVECAAVRAWVHEWLCSLLRSAPCGVA